LLLLLAADAFAVRPPETSTLGFSTVPVNRIQTQRADVQAALAGQPGWIAFTEGEGDGWTARFDEITRTPRRMMGPGIDLGPLRTEAEVGDAVMAFVDRHAELLGLADSVPVLKSVHPMESQDAWYVDVIPTVDGLEIWHAVVTFRIKFDKLVMVGSEAWPNVPVTGARRQSERAAHRAHVLQGPAPDGRHEDMTASQMLLPVVRGGKPELRRVWRTTSTTAEPVGQWEAFVDAATGDILHLTNHVRFLSGHVDAEHDVRLGDGPLELSPLRFARLTSAEGDVTFVEEDGSWSFPDGNTGPVQLALNGERSRIRDQNGSSNTEIGEGDTVVAAADFDGSDAGLTTFVNLHIVQDWARDLAPEVAWSDEKVDAFVNIDDSCNAFFDGNVNFFQESRECRNTGRLADVIFHEWGHGFHAFSIRAGFYDGSVGEGAADTMSFLMTDDPRIAPRFFKNSNGALRNVNNDRRYPEDFNTNEAFIHTNGLIFGGSMWDSREALRSSMGEPYASEVMGDIYADLLKGGPAMDTAYDEAIFADDDDGDLSNGTPHQCELVEGFGKHGLGPAGGIGISPDHDPIETSAPGEESEVKLELDNPAPDCIEIQPETAEVHFSINGGEFQSVPLDVVGEDIEGSIPGAQLGDLVEYWVDVADQNGSRYAEPPGGPIRPHTFYVGDVLVVNCNDFEEDDGNYRSELVAGKETEGADDWQHGTPIGLAGDPVGCFSGDLCWGNDLGGGNFNGEYQNDKHNALSSDVIDTKHYTGSVLQYRRWLTIEDGFYDQAVILADGEEVWTNWATDRNNGTDHHVDDEWASHVVDLAGLADDGEVQLTWEIRSDQGLAFGGWNIDDVCIHAPATPDNRLGISDLAVNRSADTIAPVVSWTMPAHAPVTEVVLVRKFGSFPTGPTDGTVLTRTTDPALGAPIAIADAGAVSYGDVYYAVYASDGTNWLSWTREGFNAAALEPGATGAGCACNGSAPSAGWLALFGLLGLRRRRA
jgi:hypothetical protein